MQIPHTVYSIMYNAQTMCNAKEMQRHLEFGEWGKGMEFREMESDLNVRYEGLSATEFVMSCRADARCHHIIVHCATDMGTPREYEKSGKGVLGQASTRNEARRTRHDAQDISNKKRREDMTRYSPAKYTIQSLARHR